MRKIERPILHGTVAGVFAGLILAGALALFASRGAIAEAMQGVWRALSVWIVSGGVRALVVVGAFCITATVGRWLFVAIARRRQPRLSQAEVDAVLVYREEKDRLSVLERSILSNLDDSSHKDYDLSEVSRWVRGASAAKANFTIESLIMRGFLGVSNSWRGPKRIWLSDKGRRALNSRL